LTQEGDLRYINNSNIEIDLGCSVGPINSVGKTKFVQIVTNNDKVDIIEIYGAKALVLKISNQWVKIAKNIKT
jgi:hypothetical protein